MHKVPKGQAERNQAYAEWCGAHLVDGDPAIRMTPDEVEEWNQEVVDRDVLAIKNSLAAGIANIVYEERNLAIVEAIRAKLTDVELSKVRFTALTQGQG